MHRRIERKFVGGVMGLWMLYGAMIQAAETPQGAPGFKHASGYLPSGQIDVMQILPPYPAPQSAADAADLAALRVFQQSGADAMRWTLAVADQELSYSRFQDAFGAPITSQQRPRLTRLLDRIEASMSSALSQGKKTFARPRPYQRMQMDRVCGFDNPPAPGVKSKDGSYPSGHSVFGWAAALALARVEPERAQQILARGQEFGESRLVCGVHHPSDVAAGRLLAGAIMGRIQATSEFQQDLQCAREEQAVLDKKLPRLSPQCAVTAAVH